MDGVAELQPALVETATTTLARAFATDPMFTWVFPDAAKREDALRRLNRVPLRYGLRYGRVTQAQAGSGVAIWTPPGHTIGIGGMVRSGMVPVLFQVGFRPMARFMSANETMERLHKRHMPEPHWYLMIVGVDPTVQGGGLGSALVAEGLAQADQMHAACYLETSSERNLPFYERHGFAVVETATLGKDGPPAWAMRRAAR